MKTNKLLHKKIAVLTITFLSCIATVFTACGHKRPEPASAYGPSDYLAISDLLPADEEPTTAPNNPFPTLSVPTYITKVEDTYFIVDCYNNQVIYNDDLTSPLYEWQVMTNDIAMGHTLASDGMVYLIDDTENNRILVM